MGEVYRARDTRLGRDIALKVIGLGAAADADHLQRFEQEARATAALNHPNILAVHDVGRSEFGPYIVSELLEGQSLRAALSSGPMPIGKALRYAQQIARGLAAAHRRGIVHRDLKPENLFVTADGLIKILDFGLAKLTEQKSAVAAGHETTAIGAVVGTVGYMSPEQARGEAVDQRSDIFSFGSVVYEMLAGQRAFQGNSPVETLSDILTRNPPELGRVTQGLPTGIERIVERCLEKNRDDRFQAAADLGFALESLSGISTVPLTPVRRLAIIRLEGGTPQRIAGAEPQDVPIVSSTDGVWLYVQTGSDVPGEIARINLRNGRRENVRTLQPPDPSGVTGILRIVMTPDASAYAYTFVRALSELYLVSGLR
jgi:eukaryotic-like serine/threonine-protein kinase